MMIRYLLINQHCELAERLAIHLTNRGHWESVGCVTDVESTLSVFSQQVPEVCFIKLSPADDNLMILAETLLNRHPQVKVVFITESNRRAVDAFAINASDFLVNPIAYERMEQCLNRIETQLQVACVQATTQNKRPAILAVKSLGRIELINIDDIYWIHGACNYVELHLKNKMILHREPLAKLLDFMNNPDFVRVHRSSIVNLNKVKLIHSEEGRFSLIAMENGAEVKISAAYRKPLLDLIHV